MLTCCLCPSVPGPQHRARQPSSQEGAQPPPRGLESRSGEVEAIWPGSPGSGPGWPPGQEAGRRLTQALGPPPRQGWGPEVSALSAGPVASPSELRFPELQSRSGPTWVRNVGVDTPEKAAVGPAWPCWAPKPPGHPNTPTYPSSSTPRALAWLRPCCELRARQSLCLGHSPPSSVTSQFPLPSGLSSSCPLRKEAICLLALLTI